MVLKLCFKFPQFEIQICETTSDGETTKTKVVDLDKNYNFVVNDFSIWICLGPKYSFQNSTRGMYMHFKNQSLWVGVVKGATYEGTNLRFK